MKNIVNFAFKCGDADYNYSTGFSRLLEMMNIIETEGSVFLENKCIYYIPNTNSIDPNLTSRNVYEMSFNESIEDAAIRYWMGDQGYVSQDARIAYASLFLALMVFGIFANFIVAFVIWRKGTLSTPRNLFIQNLVISDITICLMCPFVLWTLLHKYWIFGNVVCKLVPVVLCTNILVSSATITTISIDRQISVMQKVLAKPKRSHVAATITCIWLFSIIFSVPLYLYHGVSSKTVDNMIFLKTCTEQWPSETVRNLWVFTLISIQYIVPTSTLIITHLRIKYCLKQYVNTAKINLMKSKIATMRNKNDTILLSVAFAFAINWLPLHVLNVMADFKYYEFNHSTYFYTIYGAFQLLAMVSPAVLNPILYGWFNTSIRKELKDFVYLTFCCRRTIPDDATDNTTLIKSRINMEDRVKHSLEPRRDFTKSQLLLS